MMRLFFLSACCFLIFVPTSNVHCFSSSNRQQRATTKTLHRRGKMRGSSSASSVGGGFDGMTSCGGTLSACRGSDDGDGDSAESLSSSCVGWRRRRFFFARTAAAAFFAVAVSGGNLNVANADELGVETEAPTLFTGESLMVR